MTASYRYLFCDLLTDQVLADLELTQVGFDRRIIQPGTFNAIAPVPNEAVARQVRRIVPAGLLDWHTGPGRTVCHVYRNDALWGTYLIWSAKPQSVGRGGVQVALQGATLESYLNRVEIREDLTYTGQDQTSGIAAALVNHMQAQPHADIGLIVTAPATGQLRDRTYLRSEAATYGQRLSELAAVLNGFEYMIRTYEDAGVRVREFVTATTLSGSTVDHVFDQPGNVESWEDSFDATNAATNWQTRGATINTDLGAASEPLMSNTWLVDELTDVGWPRLDRTVDYNTVTDFDTLQGYVHWWRDNRSGLVRVPQLSVRLEGTSFNPNSLGDYALTTLVNQWWPLDGDGKPTYSQRSRIVGCEVTPPTRTSPEICKMIFAEGS